MTGFSSKLPDHLDTHASNIEHGSGELGSRNDAQEFAQWSQAQVPKKEGGDEVPLGPLESPNKTPTGPLPRSSLPQIDTRQRQPSGGFSGQSPSPTASSASSGSEHSFTQADFDKEYPNHFDFYKESFEDGRGLTPQFKDPYEKNRIYTGTTSERLAQMRQFGADPTVRNPEIVKSFEQQIAADPLGNYHVHQQLANLGTHNYGSRASELGSGNSADPKNYAEGSALDERDRGNPSEPALARSFWPTDVLKVEKDPDVVNGEALRTPNHVAPGLILNSHSAAPKVSEASELYRQELNDDASRFSARHGVAIDPLTAEQGAELLRGRQTPSEYDFKMRTPRKLSPEP